jgi:hypothetical protein
MNQELFNYILINQPFWEKIYKTNYRDNKLNKNRLEKHRARIIKQNKKSNLLQIGSEIII